jgi:hypothetical protein
MAPMFWTGERAWKAIAEEAMRLKEKILENIVACPSL